MYEKFLGFYEIPDIKSATIVAVIKDILARYRLSLDALRGQCYDGESNMLGKSSGVAVQLQAIQPRAPYTHCHAHSLSLSVKDVTKSITILRDTMGTAGEIIILIKFSPKRENLLGKSSRILKALKRLILFLNYLKLDGHFAQIVSREYWIITIL